MASFISPIKKSSSKSPHKSPHKLHYSPMKSPKKINYSPKKFTRRRRPQPLVLTEETPVTIIDYINSLYPLETPINVYAHSIYAKLNNEESSAREDAGEETFDEAGIEILKDNKTKSVNEFSIIVNGKNTLLQTSMFTKVERHNEFIHKIYTFEKSDIASYVFIINEICMQLAAYNSGCGLKIPNIIDYFRETDIYDNYKITIVMEFLQLVSTVDSDGKLSSDGQIILDKYDELKPKIETSLDCLLKNNIFHNDTHCENLGFVANTEGSYDVALIDFGKTTYGNKENPSRTGFYKGQTPEQFSDWLLHKFSEGQPDIYGGKTTNKSKKRNKTKKRSKTKKL